MNPFYEKMREDIERHEMSQVRGLSSREVVGQRYTEGDFQHLIGQLYGPYPNPDTTFRLSCFIFERKEALIAEHLRQLAADALAPYVGQLPADLDVQAAEIFLAWGSHRPDHRQIGLWLLQHANSEIRSRALTFGPRFLRPRDYAGLLAFHKDKDVSEIAMGGPLRFVLRDQALALLEQLTGCPQSDGDCFETIPQGRVSYRSWSRFLNWYEAHRNQFKNA